MNQVRNYQTKQKLVILDFLQRHINEHMTADVILNMLKDENTPISKATLYRFLDNLIEIGEVKKFNIDNTSSCYQYIGEGTKHDVYHLLCNTCGKVMHVDNSSIEKLNDKIEKSCDFKIDQSRTVFYGICKECMKK